MKYLLDTHTFLWSLFSPDKLSSSSFDLLSDAKNDIYLSIVTLWEISLKYNLGKLDLQNVTPGELPDLAKKSGFEILNLNEYDVSSFYKLPKLSHKDPFGRLLIWQAVQNNFTIISKDESFQDYLNFGLTVFL